MEFDWSTFVLEIINFLILVWILKHFLYTPVINMIEQRQSAINEKLDSAEELKNEADRLLDSYNNRLSEWELEKQESRQVLDQEIQRERALRLNQLKQELEQEREKVAVIEQRKQAELQLQAETAAIRMGARFTAKLFEGLSGPEVEHRLIRLFVDELQGIDDEDRHRIRANADGTTREVIVQTAYEADESYTGELEAVLVDIAGQELPVRYEQDPELVAGIKVIIGAFVLQANIQDELQEFARYSHGNGTE